MCNSNCGCNSKCDCLVLPQAVGPQGPPGQNGTNGLDAGNVIQTWAYSIAGGDPFIPGVATPNFQSYDPAITIRVPENFEIIHDRLKVRAIFHLDEEVESYLTNIMMGVAIDTDTFTGDINNVLVSLQRAPSDIFVPSYFYMEFYMSLQETYTPADLISFNVIGHAKFSVDYISGSLTRNIFVNDFPDYVIFKADQRTSVPSTNDFKMRLFTSPNSAGITPRYFSVEYCKKERP